MKVHSVLLARSLQPARSASGAIGYIPDILQEIQARYGFLVVPKEEDLLSSDLPKGIEFKHGRIVKPDGQKIVIDQFTVFPDGVVADTASSTDDSDVFLSDLLEWATNSLPKVLINGPRFYLSNLEILLDHPLVHYLSAFRTTGEKLTRNLEDYGMETSPYEPTSVHMHFDLAGQPQPQPGPFVLERRLNLPYSQNLWFAQAPLRTADHIALLQEFESR